jgi:hypothetical protein
VSILAYDWHATFAGLGACLAGLGSLFSGYAALKVARSQVKGGTDETTVAATRDEPAAGG